MKIIQSNLLKEFNDIEHGFTSKINGNLAFHVGDDKESVIQNHTKLSKYLSYDKDSLVHMKQIHSSIVKKVDKSDDFNHPPICDALITDKKNTPLMVMVADCSPILFYDAKREIIAVAHAGRKGAFTNIIFNVIQSFKNDFSSDPQDIFVSIGSSILECCYEVGEEIYKEAEILNLEYALSFKDNSYYLDISKILYKQLLNAGVKRENIEISQNCSCCSKELFSYRREDITGRFAGVIFLK